MFDKPFTSRDARVIGLGSPSVGVGRMAREVTSTMPKTHRSWACCVVVAVTMPAALGSQVPGATLAGRVVQKSDTSRPVTGAQIILGSDDRHVVTDSTGRYLLGGIPVGVQHVVVRALGFRPVEFSVALHEGLQGLEDIQLDAAPGVQELAPVAIAAPAAAAASYRLVDFERRRRTGRGHYLDDIQIKQSGASRLSDLMRGMRGVTEHCAGSGCTVQMVRARPGCDPDYIVDGRMDNMFGSTTPIRDIVALEVYTGPSDVPGEFAGRSAGCGVVVIWTRAGPDRRKR